MFDQLSERLQSTLHGFGQGKQLTDENIEAALRDVRRALLEADVNLRALKAFLSRVKDRAIGENVLKSLDPSETFIGIVYEELVRLLGGEHKPLDLSGQPAKIVLFGLQGSGKTTSAGKLALHLRRQGKKPLLIAADVYRPAAITQLVSLGKQVNLPVFHRLDTQDVLAICREGLAQAEQDGHDVVIIDTAGRLQVDTDMMAELLLLTRIVQPQERLLVVDGMTGQAAVQVSESFHTQLGMTGLILTKLDGDARGGAALSVVEITGQPIKFIGTSERLDGLEAFHPERLASRILGMGDVLSLVEKAQQAIDLEDAKAMEQKLRKQTFSLDDFMKIRRMMGMLGSFDQILGMLPIPGLNKEMRETLAHGGEKQLRRVEAMIQSMTPAERQAPEAITESRRQRIAKGCGIPEEEVSAFLQQFEMMRQMMGMMTQLTDGMKKGKLPDPSSIQKMAQSAQQSKKAKKPSLDARLAKEFSASE